MMKRYTIQSDIKRAVCSKGFIAGVAGLVAIIVFAGMESIIEVIRATEPLQNGFHAQLILNALQSDAFTLALPILCVLPFTTAFVDDIKSGYIKQFLPRAGLGQYITAKTAACALSGGLSVLLGALAGYAVLWLVLSPMEALGKSTEGQALRLLEKLAVVFFSGALWSTVGFLLASVTESRYMAYAGPFVICYVLIILYERYFNKLYILYPREWLNPSDKWPLGAWGAALLMLVFTIAICCIFALWARGKLVEE